LCRAIHCRRAILPTNKKEAQPKFAFPGRAVINKQLNPVSKGIPGPSQMTVEFLDRKLNEKSSIASALNEPHNVDGPPQTPVHVVRQFALT
jgi:hypothetical protein